MRNKTQSDRLRFALLLAVLAAVSLPPFSAEVLAQRNVRASNRQIGQLLTRIQSRANSFRNSFADSANSLRNNNARRSDIFESSNSFVEAANQLPAKFRQRNLDAGDVQNLLAQADRVDETSRGIWLSASASNDWRMLRSDLATLANYYNVTWNPTNASNASYQPQRRGNWLTGTWRLDRSRSDNIDNVVNRETRSLSTTDQERARTMLTRRLDSPEMLALQRQGRQITMVSTSGPQVSFDANGVTRTETNNNGRNVRVRASLAGEQLSVNSTGDRGNDYNVTFTPIDNGQRLRVTRSIYTDRLNRPVTVNSVYERSADTAQLNLYDNRSTDNAAYNNRGAGAQNRGRRVRSGAFYIPDGTLMTAVLNTNLDTRNVRDGERFTMTVRTPRQYDGAVLEGVVVEADRSGRVTGRAELGLDFERIRLRNGQTYEFAGYLESIRTPNGEDIRVDNEGSVKDDDSQTTRTVTRSGIGAALGAIIGAVAGGGKGAAIGAAIGAGAGAGSVFIQGREDLELPTGTEVTLRASAPRTTEARR
jgi:hypothetical protein